VKQAANEARSEAAKAQHAVSKPWAGEEKPKDGEASREARPSDAGKTAAALAKKAEVSRATMERAMSLRPRSALGGTSP
jgi:hypothetical protein